MKDIALIRAEIDRIDKLITELFEKRMELSEQVAEYKKQNGLPALNKQREKEVLEKLHSDLNNDNFFPYAEKLFRCLMDLSKDYQKKLGAVCTRIGYQGVEGSFSHEACMRYIADRDGKETYLTCSYDTFKSLSLGLINGEISLAVVPLENSSTGAIADVYDLLLEYDYKIVGEVYVSVNHSLLAKSGTKLSDVTEVYSHPQAFFQTGDYADKHGFTAVTCQNTAMAAEFVSKSPRRDVACIASESAAKIYGLDILDHNINYNNNNCTRFVVLSQTAVRDPQNDKMTVITKLKNSPGEFHALSEIFSENNVNVVRIESRPDIGDPFEYLFFIDFIGNEADESIKSVLAKMCKSMQYFKYLGNYKKSER